MRTIVALTAIALSLGLGSPTWAQPQSADFRLPENWNGDSITPEDKLVPRDASGDLQGFGGAAWWQALAFCAGSLHAAASGATLPAGVTPQLLRSASTRFETAALRRLQTDRGVSSGLAGEILASDIEFQVTTATEERRPVAADMARCNAVRTGNAALG